MLICRSMTIAFSTWPVHVTSLHPVPTAHLVTTVRCWLRCWSGLWGRFIAAMFACVCCVWIRNVRQSFLKQPQNAATKCPLISIACDVCIDWPVYNRQKTLCALTAMSRTFWACTIQKAVAQVCFWRWSWVDLYYITGWLTFACIFLLVYSYASVVQIWFHSSDCVESTSQTIDKVGQLLWAWFSFLRKSADEIVEPWHTSLLTMLFAIVTAKEHKKRTVWVRRWLLICWSCICFKVNWSAYFGV